MFKHVIVPFDGRPETRAALTPAGDLAWRCGAKLVVVTTNAAEDTSLRVALKSQAITKSGADVDFWVDLERSLDEALVEAARHRADPIVCVAVRHRQQGLLRRRTVMTPLPEAVLRRSPAPVLLVGPEVDVGRGLSPSAMVVAVDTSAEAEQGVAVAAAYAEQFRLDVRLVAVVPPGADHLGTADALRPLLDEVAARAPRAGLEVVEAEQPAAALVAIVGERSDAVLVLPSTGGDERGPLGAVAREAVERSHGPVLFPPPAG